MSPHQPSAFGQYGEHHTIETPEQTQLEFAVAGIGSRFLALALDLLIQIGVGIVVFLVMLVLVGSGFWTNWRQARVWLMAIVAALVFVLHFGYFILFEFLWSGQTPGKRKVGIRVVKESGRSLTFAETVGRNLLRIVDELPGAYGVGTVVALLNSQNKRLGDFAAGSLVVRETSLADLRPAWSAPPAAAPGLLSNSMMLLPDELALIDAFLARRSELPGDIRARMAAGILHRLQPKLPTAASAGLSTESLLEQLATEQRTRARYGGARL
ncbi:MAG: RDD family protein [Acidobacteriaceae bacterium]|nr:RDD family protein [Acidobacteriaceae bacterium]